MDSEVQSSAFVDANIIFLLGGPGAGKGTHSVKLAADFPLVHVSVGDLMREERTRCSPEVGDLIEKCMREGTVVPLEVVIGILKMAITRHVAEGRKNFIVDNFPRNMQQARAFEEQIGACSAALYFLCSEETLLQRLLARANTSGRVDDNEITFQKRMKDFRERTVPVIEHLKNEGKLIEVDCERRVDELYPSIKQLVATLLVLDDVAL